MDTLIIRQAKREDSTDLAILAAQLGYPTTANQVEARLPRYLDSDERCVLVAEHEGMVIGWTSLEIVDHFYIEKYVEISGFVVDEAHRGRGVGHALMDGAERWAMARNIDILRLRANTIRTEAHRFYESLGFTRLKTQIAFMKNLAAVRELG